MWVKRKLGDRVERDEVVAVLDIREVADAKSEFLTSSVKADLERTNFDRQQSLWDKRISSEQSFLQAKSIYAEAALAFDLARQKLSALGLNAMDVAAAQKREEVTPNTSSLRRYELRSPLKGRVVERKVDICTTVGGVGDPSDLYKLTDLTNVWVELAVATVELPSIREGATVVITPSSDGDGRRAEGRVMFISPLLNLETRSARIVVTLPNPDLTWRPGTFVTAEIEIAKEPVAVRLPKAAFQTLGGKRAAFVRTPTGFVARAVKIGRSDDDFIEVVSGISPGDGVAVGNTFLLKAELGKSETDR
ncbi:RND family efflux transporter, MFP subunit [Methylobacterium sp. ap11]|nr:RND family efflux transporter, MFP subunit [Methylobacterium sp. ap11]